MATTKIITLAGDWLRPCRDCGMDVTSAGDWSVTAIRNGRAFRKSYCNTCVRARSANHDRENPEQAKAREYRRVRDWSKDPRVGTPERKALTRKYNIRRKFGITVEEYEAMFEASGGKCAICDICIVLSSPIRSELAHLDHCHETGQLRGFLCTRCNPMLGFAKDDIGVLEKAIEYLKRSRFKEE